MEVNVGYCNAFQSAGSVNKYGYCEICNTVDQTTATVRQANLSEVSNNKKVYEVSTNS